ncbi:hypothetical protein D3C85_1355450 [compost metagenome]
MARSMASSFRFRAFSLTTEYGSGVPSDLIADNPCRDPVAETGGLLVAPETGLVTG